MLASRGNKIFIIGLFSRLYNSHDIATPASMSSFLLILLAIDSDSDLNTQAILFAIALQLYAMFSLLLEAYRAQ